MAIPLLDSENLIKQISTSTATTTRTANRTLKHNQQKFHVNFMSKRVVDKVIIPQQQQLLSCTELAWVLRFCIYYFMLS